MRRGKLRDRRGAGCQPGDHRTVTVTFPENYGAAEFQGKEAVFEALVLKECG